MRTLLHTAVSLPRAMRTLLHTAVSALFPLQRATYTFTLEDLSLHRSSDYLFHSISPLLQFSATPGKHSKINRRRHRSSSSSLALSLGFLSRTPDLQFTRSPSSSPPTFHSASRGC